MNFDGVVTRKIVNELNKYIKGGKVQKIYQPSKYELLLSIYSMGKSRNLLVSANNNEARINFTDKKYENPEVPDNFCMVLRKHLSQAKIISISQYGLDRVVEFELSSIDEMGFDKSKKLVVEIMGRHSNIILTDESYKIIDSIKKVNSEMSSVRQIFPSLRYESIKSGKIDILDEDFSKDISYIDQRLPDNIKPFKIFYKYYEGFSPLLGKELVSRVGIDSDINWGLVSEDEKVRLNEEFLNLRLDILENNLHSFTYQSGKKLKEFHTIELSHLNFIEKSYDLMSQAVDIFYRLNRTNDRLMQMKNSLLKKVENHKKSIQKKIRILKSNLENEEKISSEKSKGDILAANLYKLKGKEESIVLNDFYNDNKPIKISLDPTKSPWENVNSFYKRSKKIKSSVNYAKADLPKQKDLLSYLEQVEDFINRAESISDLEEIREEMIDNKLIKKRSKGKNKKKSKKSSPYHFKTKSGADIFIGKNSRQNDYITLKLANKDDLWFHVKDLAGSHVILKSNKLNDKDIKIAAYLAAKYSSVSSDNKVDVDYTQKKNVNKAKGAKAGMVYYENFNTITINMDADIEDEIDTI